MMRFSLTTFAALSLAASSSGQLSTDQQKVFSDGLSSICAKVNSTCSVQFPNKKSAKVSFTALKAVSAPPAVPQPIVYTLAAGDDLQTVLDSYTDATVEVTILVPPTYSYSKPLTLRNRATTNWITIASTFSFAPSTRVGPADAGNMPTLIATDSSAVISTEAQAHNYKLVGFNITASTTGTNWAFIGMGTYTETSVAQLPHDISILNCYIHAPDRGEFVRGIFINGVNVTVQSSYITNFKSTFMEANAIYIGNASNVTLNNNFLDGAAENVCTDCAGTSIPNFVPDTITISHNYFWKNPAYRNLSPAVYVKNLLEFKNGKNIVIDSNVFENSWQQNQNGDAVLFTPRTNSGQQPQNTIQNVTFSNNTVRHVAGGIVFGAYDDLSGVDRSQYSAKLVRTAHFTISNNLFDDISGNEYAPGAFAMCFQIGGPPADMTFTNNTCQSPVGEARTPVGMFLPESTDLTDSTWKNNILEIELQADGRWGPSVIASENNPSDPQLPNTPVVFAPSNVIQDGDPNMQAAWSQAVPGILFQPAATSGANLTALSAMEAQVKAGSNK